MAGEARHFLVAVCAILRLDPAAEFEPACFRAVAAHQFRTRGLGVEDRGGRIDAVLDEADLPFKRGVDKAALDQDTAALRILHPLKAALSIGIAQKSEVVAFGRSGGASGAQGGIGIGGAVAILAPDLDGVGDLAIDEAVAMRVLFEVAVDALHSDFGVDRHHMDRFARIGAGLDELALAILAPALTPAVFVIGGFLGRIAFLGGAEHLALCIEHIAVAVAFEDRAEVPAVAVIIGELRVFEIGVQIVDVAQEFEVGPLALGRGAFGVAVGDFAHFLGSRIFLLLGPHGRRIAFVIPHSVAEIGIQEDVGLVHVAVHALRGRDGAGEDVLERVALFLQRVLTIVARLFEAAMARRFLAVAVIPFHLRVDRRVDRDRLTVAAILRVDEAVARFAVIGVDNVAACAARMAVIARLVVRAHEPCEGVVEAGLVDVERRDRDAQTRAGATVRLLEVGATRLFQPLYLASRAGQADFRELRVDGAPAALEHAEDVCGRDDVPCGQRVKLFEDAARLLFFGQPAFLAIAGRCDDITNPCHRRRVAAAGVGFADDVILEGQDAVIVARPAPQHRAGRHDRSLGGFDRLNVARSAGLARDAVV